MNARARLFCLTLALLATALGTSLLAQAASVKGDVSFEYDTPISGEERTGDLTVVVEARKGCSVDRRVKLTLTYFSGADKRLSAKTRKATSKKGFAVFERSAIGLPTSASAVVESRTVNSGGERVECKRISGSIDLPGSETS